MIRQSILMLLAMRNTVSTKKNVQMVTYNTRMLETLMTVQRKITGLEHVHLDSLMYIDVYVGPWS